MVTGNASYRTRKYFIKLSAWAGPELSSRTLPFMRRTSHWTTWRQLPHRCDSYLFVIVWRHQALLTRSCVSISFSFSTPPAAQCQQHRRLQQVQQERLCRPPARSSWAAGAAGSPPAGVSSCPEPTCSTRPAEWCGRADRPPWGPRPRSHLLSVSDAVRRLSGWTRCRTVTEPAVGFVVQVWPPGDWLWSLTRRGGTRGRREGCGLINSTMNS